MMTMTRLGIDVGSTTVKVVAIGKDNNLIFNRYERHHAKARETLTSILYDLMSEIGDQQVAVRLTGSVGMGISEQYALPFVQEVVAATKAIQMFYPTTKSMIDIGGEDAKVVFFRKGEATDLRMNGNCAGGTGAFIDQMAVILGIDVSEMNDLALKATRIYPIASRCGVFCKTDIQNLIAKNVCREDIAASIFRAVAVQTVVTLAHGYDITPPILLCGGPLTYIPALRKAFSDYLKVSGHEIILPEHGTLLPAIGTALYNEKLKTGTAKTADSSAIHTLSELIVLISGKPLKEGDRKGTMLKPVFGNDAEYKTWRERISKSKVVHAPLEPGVQDAYIGIDSGSTTTKIVVMDARKRILCTFYANNAGNPIETVSRGLEEIAEKCIKKGTILNIRGCCSTGYGEDLIRAAFGLDYGIVETMAHYMAAAHLNPRVSFILDIGGQDMKAIFVRDGIIDRIEINEACSSGCGSFIETFAKTLGYTVADFATTACSSEEPCDLGTRCTVFMNSKVKQSLREGATVNDIAAGLAYSVVKNCLYKVLKLKDLSALGKNIVVQGGTMRNDAVVRALELLTGSEVKRSDCPELMGAFGCALYSSIHQGRTVSLDDIISAAHYTSKNLHCKGCDNSCLVVKYTFANGMSYYSGNRCEKVFTNSGKEKVRGENVYAIKNALLFGNEESKKTGDERYKTPAVEEPVAVRNSSITIGIPRVLNMFEDYPFWHTLFTECGLNVELSDVSNYMKYECSANKVMSDNICFPAKLVHSHIKGLVDKGVSRIFMPFVVYERSGTEHESYNCPVVTGYSEVVKSVQSGDVPIDSPTISFKDEKLLYIQCRDYLRTLNVEDHLIKGAFAKAQIAQNTFIHAITRACDESLERARSEGKLTILLAGRPYHSDPLIQHKVADMMADMGINVITDDIVREKDVQAEQAHILAQWAYPNRIMKAATWCAKEGDDVQFVEMTSFGCGPDAFLTDEVRDLLARHHKVLTLLKLDDINNVGSMKLRVRSLVESLRLAREKKKIAEATEDFKTVPIFSEEYKNYKIIVPYFTPFLSPLIPAIMRRAGYDVENLPMSDVESCECGLEYANNEVCYPATLIVGDIVKAFKSGKYDPKKTAVAMTQTGGQCRASNYVSLIKRALIYAGYDMVPVVALTFGGSIKNEQPGFKMNWLKILPLAFYSIVYSDCIAKFYHASLPREKQPGAALALKDKYLAESMVLIEKNDKKGILKLLAKAADEFDGICTDKTCPKVGVVGEIFLKFNPFAQHNVTDWLISQGVEVVPPVMSDFFLQTFVNRKADKDVNIERRTFADTILSYFYKKMRRKIEHINEIASRFRYYTPFDDIFEKAESVEDVITLNAQFGEGWLLPAEIMTWSRQGVNNIVSLQPFGCIANHIVSKGVEKRIKQLRPDINILSLDFDSGVSDVNITNRMMLFCDHLR